MRALITGSTGFIGTHLVKKLRESSKYEEIYGVSRNRIQGIPCEMIYGDISSREFALYAISKAKPDVIYHLASDIRSTQQVDDLPIFVNQNILPTVNLLEAVLLNSYKIKSFINVGSCEEYGNQESEFTEDMTPFPSTLYSGTKAASSLLCMMLQRVYKLPIVHVRPSLIYGPLQRERFFISQAIRKFMSDQDFHMSKGEQFRDFLYIDDLVDALMVIGERGEEFSGEIFNISYGSSIQLRDIVVFLHELMNSKSKIHYGSVPYREGEIMNYRCSNKKLIEMTNWKPQTELVQGLNKTVEYYRSAQEGVEK